ncbi:MAG TPA: hypothetical protein VHM47_07970 [Actinomycetota bacterium]|jgi:hypothetical protein|nr:hypothetical protein [Actinomycetota bacterium]
MRQAVGRLRGSRRPSTVTVVRPYGSLRDHAVERAHNALDEVPGILRGFRIFLLMASVAMVAFAVGVVFVIARAVG